MSGYRPTRYPILAIQCLLSIPVAQLEELDLNINIHDTDTVSMFAPLVQFKGLRRLKMLLTSILNPPDVGDFITKLIAHNPHLLDLDIRAIFDLGILRSHRPYSRLTLHDVFGRVPTNNDPLKLTHLSLFGFSPLQLDSVTLPHLKYLTSLVVRHHGRFSNLSLRLLDGVWKTLGKEAIYLKELQIDNLTMEALTYLGSYSGLERLHVGKTIHSFPIESDLLNYLCRTVLPKHSASFVDLAIIVAYQELGCFGEGNMSSILKCQNLSYLCVRLPGEISAIPTLTVSPFFFLVRYNEHIHVPVKC